MRDGVCDRDVPRDDGLELRDWRKSSIGISSDLDHEKSHGLHEKCSSFLSYFKFCYLGRGVRGLDSRERTLLLAPFTRFRDVSRDLAPPAAALLGDRSLHKTKKKSHVDKIEYKLPDCQVVCMHFELTDQSNDYV